jgi:hypothetical protein
MKNVLNTFLTAGILSVILLLQSVTTSQALTVYSFSVPITAPWYDTGIDVTAGQAVNITASGTVRFGPFSSQTTDPNGGDSFGGTTFDALAVYPNTVVVSLIGKIGGTTAIGTGTPLLAGVAGNGLGFVGSTYSQLASTSGRLFLGFNDEVNQFFDNSGTFSVLVSVPEPSTAALASLGVLAFVGFRKTRRTPVRVSGN